MLLHLPEMQFHFNLHFKHAYGLPQYYKSRIEFHQYSKYIIIFFKQKEKRKSRFLLEVKLVYSTQKPEKIHLLPPDFPWLD